MHHPARRTTLVESRAHRPALSLFLSALFFVALLTVAAAPATAAGPQAGDAEPAAEAAAVTPPWEDGSWESGFVTTPDGVRIHYFEVGPAQPPTPDDGSGEDAEPAPSLLFVPGWTLPGQIFEPQIRHFSAHHRVVAMDPRSQGLSDRPDEGHYPAARGRDVQAVIEELGLAPVVPVCWSLAVGECVAMAEEFGTDHLAGLVLVDGLAGGEWSPASSPFMVGWVGRLMRDREAGTASFIRSMYRTPQAEPYLEEVTRWSLDTPTDAMAALMVGGLTYDKRDVLDGLELPVLMTVTESPFLPLYEEMRDRLPEVRFEVFQAGHALFIDEPERFNRILGEFVEDGVPPAGEDSGGDSADGANNETRDQAEDGSADPDGATTGAAGEGR